MFHLGLDQLVLDAVLLVTLEGKSLEELLHFRVFQEGLGGRVFQQAELVDVHNHLQVGIYVGLHLRKGTALKVLLESLGGEKELQVHRIGK